MPTLVSRNCDTPATATRHRIGSVKFMRKHAARTLGLVTIASVSLLTTACAAPAPAPASVPSSATPTPSPTPSLPTVAGYPVGEFPAVPLFAIPDLSMLDAEQSAVSLGLAEKLSQYPGLEVSNAHCDASGAFLSSTSSMVLYGDGSGTFTDPDGSAVNYGDGSGVTSIGGTTIVNYGDGSGTYTDDEISIVNYGDGTGLVDGAAVTVDPIAAVPPIGSFPPIGALQPLDACGTVVTLSDSVLFDFDKSDLRAEASAILQQLATAMQEVAAPAAIVTGHTDSVGDDDYNQTLSEARAEAVVGALVAAGVTSELTAEGRGESEPVAPNETNGQDYPAGRQLNRRVEIIIPAF